MFDNGCFLRRQRRFRCPQKEALRNAVKLTTTSLASSSTSPQENRDVGSAIRWNTKVVPVERVRPRDCREVSLPVGWDRRSDPGPPHATSLTGTPSHGRPCGTQPSACACAGTTVLDHVTQYGCCQRHRQRPQFSISRIIADNAVTSSMADFRFAERVRRATMAEHTACAAHHTLHCDHDVIQQLSNDSRRLYYRHDVISGVTVRNFHSANTVVF